MRIVKTTNGKNKIKMSHNEWLKIGQDAGWDDSKFSIGDEVILKNDVLKEHARSVPAHADYTTEQLKWRDTLRELAGEVGEIARVFPNSDHVNVRFDDILIGIAASQLERV